TLWRCCLTPPARARCARLTNCCTVTRNDCHPSRRPLLAPNVCRADPPHAEHRPDRGHQLPTGLAVRNRVDHRPGFGMRRCATATTAKNARNPVPALQRCPEHPGWRTHIPVLAVPLRRAPAAQPMGVLAATTPRSPASRAVAPKRAAVSGWPATPGDD